MELTANHNIQQIVDVVSDFETAVLLASCIRELYHIVRALYNIVISGQQNQVLTQRVLVCRVAAQYHAAHKSGGDIEGGRVESHC